MCVIDIVLLEWFILIQVVAETPKEASTRVRMISDKVRRRAYQTAMAKAGAIQKRSLDAVEKLMYTVDLVMIHSSVLTK